MTETYDVLIVGGGPAGAAAAISLAKRGSSVLLLERSDYRQVRVGETLPPRARLPLEQLGVWEHFVKAEHLPSPGTRAAWGTSEIQTNDFIYNPYGSGWHLDRARFDAMLAQHAAQVGAQVRRGERITHCGRNGGLWRIESDARVWHSRFLVDATGRTALVARQLGMRRLAYDRLVGIVGIFGPAAGDDRTLVEAAQDGWWYSATVPGGRRVLAYMTDADLVPSPRSRLNAWWEQKLQATIHTRAACLEWVLESPLRTLAANTCRLARAAGGGWLAVGDAAYAVDPLSSRGIFNALEMGEHAGAAIDQCLLGNPRGLREYIARVERQFTDYLESRAEYYALEGRWMETPFWRRRQNATSSSSLSLVSGLRAATASSP